MQEGWTPLQLAVPRGHLQAIELLLLKGADTKAVAVVRTFPLACLPLSISLQPEHVARSAHCRHAQESVALLPGARSSCCCCNISLHQSHLNRRNACLSSQVVHMAAVVVRSNTPEPRSKLVRTDKVADVGALLLAHGAIARPYSPALRAPPFSQPSLQNTSPVTLAHDLPAPKPGNSQSSLAAA